MNRNALLFIVIFIVTSCSVATNSLVKFNENHKKNIVLKKVKLENWVFKDYLLDTIPGISLDKAYKLVNRKKPKEIIVAIIDTEIDIKHEDLKGQFWVNKNEIPNNLIDDDNNGYVDDYQGWNFIGNKRGENIIYSNLESARIIQKFKNKFNGLSREEVQNQDTEDFDLFIKANDYFNKGYNSAIKEQDYASFLYNGYPKAKKSVDSLFHNSKYNSKNLDSLFLIYKGKNIKLAKNIYFISDCLKYKLTKEWIENYKEQIDKKINYTYNLDYYDRKRIDSFPQILEKNKYGNKFISKNLFEFYHGTMVAGIIGAHRNNSIGVDGISSKIKMMPIAISSNGEEHDKDISLAIRYAVDNGARIINMSFGKHFSLNKKWVFEAIRYAEMNNVLIVTSAGNGDLNLNNYNDYYPNDNIDNGKEITNNFLVVGSSSFELSSKLKSSFSNYGNIDVDIFAPGEEINTTIPNNKYKTDSGTSLSCAVVSGVAALVLSYYPNLSAPSLKKILMDSGVSYSIMINVSDKENERINFINLSKSGKIVNAYNALLIAKDIEL